MNVSEKMMYESISALTKSKPAKTDCATLARYDGRLKKEALSYNSLYKSNRIEKLGLKTIDSSNIIDLTKECCGCKRGITESRKAVVRLSVEAILKNWKMRMLQFETNGNIETASAVLVDSQLASSKMYLN